MLKTIIFNSKELNLALVKNPKLRRIFDDGRREFIFNYSDSKKSHNEHTDRSNHTDDYGDYSERLTHTDCTAGRSEHLDTKSHEDYTVHLEYSDYSDHEQYDNADILGR
jgi:hypothetical protein